MTHSKASASSGSLSMSHPPIIDGENLFSLDAVDAAPSTALCHAISNACREWGVFLLTNHGLPNELFARLNVSMHSFFDLPLSTKEEVRRSGDNAMGWANDELTKQVR